MPSVRLWLFALILVGFLPVVVTADDAVVTADDASIEESLRIMREAEDDEAFYGAVQDIVALGSDIVPELTRRLVAADDVWERVDLTVLLAMVLERAKVAGAAAAVPLNLISEVASLMMEPAEPALEANLVNLAGSIQPQPSEITEGLLFILSRAEDEGLRATTSAVIALQGDEGSLSLVHDALRRSDSDRYSGDLAHILHGSELPEDIACSLRALLSSADVEARQSASRTLEAAGIEDPAQPEAALRDLDAAETRHVPGGTPDQPASLGEVDGVLTFNGRASDGPTGEAWFAFTLPDDARVEIGIDRPGVVFDLRLPGSRGIDGVLISTAFSQEPSVWYDAKAGSYLLRTYAGEPSEYSVTISAR